MIQVKGILMAKLKPDLLVVPGQNLSVSLRDRRIFLFEVRDEAEWKMVVFDLQCMIARLAFSLIIFSSIFCSDILHPTIGLKAVCAKGKDIKLMNNNMDNLCNNQMGDTCY